MDVVEDLLKAENPDEVAEKSRNFCDFVHFELSAQPRIALSFFTGGYFNLLDRLFGERSTDDGAAAKQSWLQLTISYPNMNTTSSRGFQLTRAAAQVVRLFTLNGDDGSSLLAVVKGWNLSRAHFFVSSLPAKAQYKLFGAPEYENIRTTNCDELYDGLLFVKRYEQRFTSLNPTLDLTLFEYYLMKFARYATTLESPYPNKRSTSTIRPALSMGRVAADLRGEADTSAATVKNPLEILHSVGSIGWIRGNPYLVLLEDYMDFFFTEDGVMQEDSSLFLHILIDIWLDQTNLLRTDAPNKAGMSASLKRDGPASTILVLKGDPSEPRWKTYTLQCVYLLCAKIIGSDSYLNAALSAAWDTLDPQKVVESYEAELNRRGVSRGTHTVATPQFDILSSRPPPPSAAPGSPLRLRRRRSSSPRFGQERIPDGMLGVVMLQQPVFDMIRTVFCGQKSTSWVVFALTVEIWLMWLEPTRAVASPNAHTSSGTTSPFLHSGSPTVKPKNISTLWRRHVIQNYPFYTTLALLFFECAGGLDYSSGNEGSCYLYLLESVLEIFSPNVRLLLEACHRALEQPQQSEGFGRTRSGSNARALSRDLRLTPEEVALLHEHNRRVFRNETESAFKVVVSGFNLGNPQPKTASDIFGLMHKSRKRLCGLGTTEVQGDGKNRLTISQPATNSFIEALKYFGIINPDFELTIPPPDSGPERDEFGRLTKAGKKAVQDGLRHCTPEQLAAVYTRDVMTQPIYSTEIPVLARMLVKLSKYLNDRFELPKDDHTVCFSWDKQLYLYVNDVNAVYSTFRFNLRFLADWRVFAGFMIGLAMFFWL